MSDFEQFGERSPEQIDYLKRAMSNVGGDITQRQLNRFLNQRGSEPNGQDDDMVRMGRYVNNDPRYEAVVKGEHEALLVAVDAVAKYYEAKDATHKVREQLELEAGRLLIDANKIAGGADITVADFTIES